MPTVAQIEAAPPLTASQATRLLSLLKASAHYHEFFWQFPDLPVVVFSFVGRRFTITGATNATPIVISAAGHGFALNDAVQIADALGNTAANGAWLAGAITTDSFSLIGSTGNGAWTSGGTVTDMRSKMLSAITTALDLLKDSTLAVKGGAKGIDLSKDRDREQLVKEALDTLYTHGGFDWDWWYSQRQSMGGSYNLQNVPVW